MACQHCKSWLLDERVLLDTSANLTENGLTRNIEFLDVIEYRPYAEDFERIHRQRLTRLPGVARIHSSFALRTVKRSSVLPIRESER